MASGSILFWWLLFAGTHIGGSSQALRTALIRRLGLTGFKGIYTLVALATFIPLCSVYARHKHAGALLFVPDSSLLAATEGLMLVALVVLAQGLATPGPMSTQAELSGRFSPEVRGIQRVTRHPQNLAFILFGFSHLLVNPFSADLIFFGGFVVYGIASAIHQDDSQRIAGIPEVREYLAVTSALPFAAIVTGRQRLAAREYSRTALVGALLLYVVLRIFHSRLFG
jgi:uncharacterized membrane protein